MYIPYIDPAMSSTNNTPSDTLPSSVPKCDPAGLNWSIFFIRFQAAAQAKKKWGHFDGSVAQPTVSNPPMHAEVEALSAWEDAESVAMYLLTQRLPDSLLVSIMHHTTCAERWKAVVMEMTCLGTYSRTELHRQLLNQSPQPLTKIVDYLRKLQTKKEDLLTKGVNISNDDYRSSIITCLLTSLLSFAASQLASYSSMQEAMLDALSTHSQPPSSGTTPTPTSTAAIKLPEMRPADLINKIIDEACRLLRDSKGQGSGSGGKGKGRASGENNDVALAVMMGKNGRKGGWKKKGKCRNCGKYGHWKRDCPKPPKQKSDGVKGKEGGSAAAVTDDGSDWKDGVWAVTEEEDDSEITTHLEHHAGSSTMPDLESVSDSISICYCANSMPSLATAPTVALEMPTMTMTPRVISLKVLDTGWRKVRWRI